MSEVTLEVEKALILIKNGDETGVDLLYKIMGKTIFFISKSYLKSDSLAEDSTQNTLIDVINNINSYKKSNGYGWVIKITRNNALNLLKKEDRYINYDDDILFNNSLSTDLDKTKNQLLCESIFELLDTPLLKNMIYLKYFMDMNVREIAKELGVSKSYVAKEISKAEEKIKNSLNRGQN